MHLHPSPDPAMARRVIFAASEYLAVATTVSEPGTAIDALGREQSHRGSPPSRHRERGAPNPSGLISDLAHTACFETR